MLQASVSSGDYGEHEADMAAYRKDGEARAMALGNRGPIRYNKNGSLHDDIVEAYWRCGFYVFEDVIGTEELADIECDIEEILLMCLKWYDPIGLIRYGFDVEDFAAGTYNFIYQEPTNTLGIRKLWVWIIVPFVSLSMTLHALVNLLEGSGKGGHD